MAILPIVRSIEATRTFAGVKRFDADDAIPYGPCELVIDQEPSRDGNGSGSRPMRSSGNAMASQ